MITSTYVQVSEQQHWRQLTSRFFPDLYLSREGGDRGAALSSLSKQEGELLPSSSSSGRNDPKNESEERTLKIMDKREDDDKNYSFFCYRSAFLQKAESEVNWRRGRVVTVRQERLVFSDSLSSQHNLKQQQPLQALFLCKEQADRGHAGRQLLLAAMGDEVGVFGARVDVEEAQEWSPRWSACTSFRHGGEGAKITAMKVLDSSLVVTAGMDQLVRLFDWDGTPRGVLGHHTSPVWGMDVENAMVASSSFRNVVLSDTRRPQYAVLAFQAHGTWVRTLCLDTARHLLLSGSADASCKSWDLRRPGDLLTKFVHPNHFEEVRPSGKECSIELLHDVLDLYSFIHMAGKIRAGP